jgi:hypothetical protein
MTLIPETGDGTNPAANSYADLDYIKAYGEARGYTLPADAILEQKAISAMDYIEPRLRASTNGRKSWRGQTLLDGSIAPKQPLQYPRECAQIDCEDIANDYIPKELMDAMAAATFEAVKLDLMPTDTGALPVIRDKVGPIETEFSDALLRISGGFTGPSFPKVDSILDGIISGCGGGFFLKSVRV